MFPGRSCPRYCQCQRLACDKLSRAHGRRCVDSGRVSCGFKEKVPFDTGRKQFHYRATQRVVAVPCREHASAFGLLPCFTISQSLEPRGLLSLLLSVGSLSVSGNICLSPARHCAPPPWQHLNHISKYLIQHSEKTDSGWFPVYQWARYFFQVNARTCMCAHTTIMLKRLKRSVGYCRIHYFNTALILTCSLEQSNKYKHRLTSYIGSNVHLSSLHVLLNLRIHK